MIEDNWIIKYIMMPFFLGTIFGIVGICIFISSFFGSETPFWIGLIFIGISLVLLILSYINNRIYKNDNKKDD